MSCNFMSCNLVRHFNVRNFQCPRYKEVSHPTQSNPIHGWSKSTSNSGAIVHPLSLSQSIKFHLAERASVQSSEWICSTTFHVRNV